MEEQDEGFAGAGDACRKRGPSPRDLATCSWARSSPNSEAASDSRMIGPLPGAGEANTARCRGFSAPEERQPDGVPFFAREPVGKLLVIQVEAGGKDFLIFQIIAQQDVIRSHDFVEEASVNSWRRMLGKATK